VCVPSTEVADDVFFARGTDVNFVILRDGSDLTLIDTGYPGDRETVAAAIAELGRRPEDVRAVLITHAHIDHVGSVNHFAERYGAAVYTDPVEVRHAHREYLEQAAVHDVVANLWRPGVLPWLSRVLRVGVLQHVAIPSAEPFPTDGALDVPGRPVPVPTHGHTSGHTGYFLPAAGAVATGDGLVTGHPVVRHRGPQVLPGFFNSGDAAAGIAPLAALAADLILPGHGPALRRPIADAVGEAAERASR
jgi:glyoxylase-like metal-dependent hydrolase (beta-lactamase superfamily II)